IYRRIAVGDSSAASRSAAERVMEGLLQGENKRGAEELPENFQLQVLLADLEGFSYKESTEILDIAIGNVISRLYRGRKAMEKRLWDYAEQRGLLPDEAERP